MTAVQMDNHAACDHEMTSPPCEHNHWSDLRTRKNVKMLLCHVCFAKWRLCACRCARNSCSSWAKRGTCSMGPSCPKLHVGHARPRAQRGSPPAAETPFTDAPYGLDDAPAPFYYSNPETHEAPSAAFPGDYGDLYHGPMSPPLLRPLMLTPPSNPSAAPSEAPSALPTPSATGSGSLHFVEPWVPPASVSACGEYFEELDAYEPEGVAMTEEQLDALLRRCSLA
eukprot:TRINITY_DN719_c0_g1_i14.p2 TRINITY_DN719_c0_g1~~TRINITY_DN719_c0_g1_i14.p2  ORF type:complete len:242 (+),score=52.86 TRINITY_DN719_c0_g1_i14:53-727(+)